jgi:small subunit ribosomal protein S2
MSKLSPVSVRELLDAGVHFGHKTVRWNPKMAPYIYGIRDDVHIIDLQQTAVLMQIALNAIYETVKKNGKVLFVSTKIQASSIIAEYAEKCGQHYVNHRWLGGTLTNWDTVSRSIKKLDNIEKILGNEEEVATYTKKEILELNRDKEKWLKSLGGIRNMGGRPDLIVIIDTNKEHLAIKEAIKLGIPMAAIVDTNSDPDNIDFPIPGNDDAIRSIKLYCSLFASAALSGIEEALSTSGIDLGESIDRVGTNTQDIVRFKATKKVSKAAVVSIEDNASSKEEFEAGLKLEAQANASRRKDAIKNSSDKK